MIVVCAIDRPRSAIISTRCRRLSLNQRYQRTHRMMTSRSKWRSSNSSSMLFSLPIADPQPFQPPAYPIASCLLHQSRLALSNRDIDDLCQWQTSWNRQNFRDGIWGCDMEISTHDLWTVLHGMGFGALFMLAFSGALAELYRISASGAAVQPSSREQALL